MLKKKKKKKGGLVMEGEGGNTTGYIGTNVEKTLKDRSKCNPEGRMSYVKSSGSQNVSFFFNKIRKRDRK